MKRKEAGNHVVCKMISFILIFMLLLTGVSYIVRTNGHVKNRFAGFYAEEKNSIDVLLVGASTISTSFSPGYMWGEYGFTSYPLSTNAQRPKAIKYLLEEVYKYQSPEVVVIELRMFTYEESEMLTDEAHIREVTDNMRYSLQRVKTVAAMTDGVDKFEDKLSYYFDIIKYHSNWGMFFEKEELQRMTYRKQDLHKGFEHPTQIMPHVIEIGVIDEKLAIPKEQEVVLRDLLSYLKEKEQKALFVATPRIYEYEYISKMNYMKEIIEQEGFQFADFMYSDVYDFQTDLLDGAHTNILGAKKCSELLGEILVSDYELKNKYGSEGYDSWDESYKAFLEIYNEVNDNKEDYEL